MEINNRKELLGVDELKSISFIQAVIVEFLATTLLTLLGITSSTPISNRSEMGTALCAGFLYTALILVFGPISGGQINPAVTLGFMCIGEMNIIRGCIYILAQYLGALVGAATIYSFVSKDDFIIMTRLRSMNLKPAQGIFFEAMITMLLVLVVLAVTDKNRCGFKSTAALAIGLSVCTGNLSAIRFTGAGMNPAKIFAPAALINSFKEYYIYLVGPCLGGIIAALIYRVVMKPYAQDQRGDGNLYEYNWC